MAAGKDVHEPFFAAAASLLGAEDSSSSQSYYPNTVQSVKSGLQSLSEDQRRLIGISTISVVTRLATEFDDEEVSMMVVLAWQYDELLMLGCVGDCVDCINAAATFALGRTVC